ncbi:MAG: deaminase [Betaproteobacteria bacterium]|nr:deaminase [Betaproteobacteria bacterium]MDH5286111.1 deaminase [Betaproteobacteria bacterium]
MSAPPSRGRLRAAAAILLAPLARAVGASPAAGHERFVARAFANRDRAIAAGDQAYGAVLVCDGEVVADGVSAVVTNADPMAHAEMQALRLAMARLGRRDLSGCALYGTSRACAMCESAAAAAKVSRLYHGRDAAGGQPPSAR